MRNVLILLLSYEMFKKQYYSPTLLIYDAYCQLWGIKLSFYSFFFRLSKVSLVCLILLLIIYPLNSISFSLLWCALLSYFYFFFCCRLITQIYGAYIETNHLKLRNMNMSAHMASEIEFPEKGPYWTWSGECPEKPWSDYGTLLYGLSREAYRGKTIQLFVLAW